MTIIYTNMALSRFHTAAALQSSATHFDVQGNKTELHKMLVTILREEAEALIRLGISEVSGISTPLKENAHPST